MIGDVPPVMNIVNDILIIGVVEQRNGGNVWGIGTRRVIKRDNKRADG